MRVRSLALLLAVGCAGGASDDDAAADGFGDVLPSKRSEVLTVADPLTEQVVMFGGNDGPIVNQIPSARFLKDTWVFHPDKGWKEVAAEGPSRRGRYAVGLDSAGGRLLAFGGRFRKVDTSGDYTLYNDLWAFDLNAHTWTELAAGGAGGPRPRYYPAGAWDPSTSTFWIWGGATNTDPLIIQPSADVWSWSAGEGWVEHTATGDAPSRRVFFGNTYDSKRNRIVVFGGQIGDFQSLAYNDMYALDLDDLTWTRLHDGSGEAPSTRMHAAIDYDAARDQYVLFGGHTDLGDANDLWTFDPEAGAWSLDYEGDTFTGGRLGCIGNPSEVPADYVDQDLSAPERRHRGLHAILRDKLWVSSGIHSECSDQLDDLWTYDLVSFAWSELVPATSGESCARRGDDCECLCL